MFVSAGHFHTLLPFLTTLAFKVHLDITYFWISNYIQIPQFLDILLPLFNQSNMIKVASEKNSLVESR